MKSLQEYQPVLEKVFTRIIGDYDFSPRVSLQEAFDSENRVVTILNHSTPLSWLPAVCLLVDKICDSGGGGRVPVGVMDKFFFQNPFFKPMAAYFTQFSMVPSFDDLMRKSEAGYTDVAIFPEGSNCFFGEGEVIQPFRSPRFIELALKTQSKIFLVVHRGSEDWARSVQLRQLPFRAYLPGWLNERIEQGGFFVIPKYPKKISKFHMTCDFYEPELKIEDLSRHRAERMQQLWGEAEKVRVRMQQMFDGLEAS